MVELYTPKIWLKIIYSEDFRELLIPHLRQKYLYRHVFFMDNYTKHTSKSTTRFMLLNNINHFQTPTESSDLMPIEMV